jgi:hypothetical protein
LVSARETLKLREVKEDDRENYTFDSRQGEKGE